jgi:hypothetical protein
VPAFVSVDFQFAHTGRARFSRIPNAVICLFSVLKLFEGDEMSYFRKYTKYQVHTFLGRDSILEVASGRLNGEQGCLPFLLKRTKTLDPEVSNHSKPLTIYHFAKYRTFYPPPPSTRATSLNLPQDELRARE